MMIDPPVEKLIQKAPCRYALVVAITKRTKELLSSDNNPDFERSGKKAISYAASEIYDGKLKIVL